MEIDLSAVANGLALGVGRRGGKRKEGFKNASQMCGLSSGMVPLTEIEHVEFGVRES